MRPGYQERSELKIVGRTNPAKHSESGSKTKLEHTFADDKITKGSTTNLMDYSANDSLVRYQWQNIHDPAIFDPVQSDEDGAASGKNRLLALMNSIGSDVCIYLNKCSSKPTITDKAIICEINGITYKAVIASYDSKANSIEIKDGNTTTTTIKGKYQKIDIPTDAEELIIIGDGEDSYLCVKSIDYTGFCEKVEVCKDDEFVQKFTKAVADCYREYYDVKNITNLTDEEISSDILVVLDQLLQGNKSITDEDGVERHTLKAHLVYTSLTSSDEEIEYAENFVPEDGAVKIWVHKDLTAYHLRSDVTGDITSITGLSKVEARQAINENICEQLDISKDPIDFLAKSLYEYFDAAAKKVRYARVPQRVWDPTHDDYNGAVFWAWQYYIKTVEDEGTKYKTLAGEAIKYEITQAFPDMKEALEGLSKDDAEFAFYCGLWNGLVEVVASVPESASLLSALFSETTQDEFENELELLNNFEDENGNIGFWAAMKYGFTESTNNSYKLSELGGEMMFVVTLSIANPDAITAISASLANIVKAIQFADKFSDALNPLGYAMKFTTEGVGVLLDGSKREVARITNSALSAKVYVEGEGVVNLTGKELDNLNLQNDGNRVLAISDGKTYTLISKVDADIYELIAKLTYSIDATTIARSRTALGAIANNLSDIQIKDIIKKNYLASGKEYLKVNFPLTDEHLNTLRSELQKISFQKGKPPIGHDMTKILHPDLLENIEGGAKFIPVHPDYRKVTGYVGRAEDFKGGNIDQVMKDYRLDYGGKNPYLAANGKDKGYAVVRYKNTAGELDIPTNTDDGLPNTKTGMVGNDSRVIFEYKYKPENGRPYENGDILEYFDKDGVSKGQYRYGTNDTNEIGWNLIE